MSMTYIGLIRKEAKSDYGVDFPDFPGCVSAGKTLEEARVMASEALSAHVEFMLEDGDALPKASSLDDIMAKKENRDAVVTVVAVQNPQASKRVNITVKEDALKKIDNYAKKNGMTRSQFLTAAAIHQINSRPKARMVA